MTLSTLLAALTAPWASLLAVVAHVTIVNVLFVAAPTTIWMDVGLFAPFVLWLSYTVTCLAGIPAHLVLWYSGRSGVWSYVAAGALVAALASVAIFGISALSDWRSAAYVLSFCVLVGTVVAATFRAIFVFFLEPDRSER